MDFLKKKKKQIGKEDYTMAQEKRLPWEFKETQPITLMPRCKSDKSVIIWTKSKQNYKVKVK